MGSAPRGLGEEALRSAAVAAVVEIAAVEAESEQEGSKGPHTTKHPLTNTQSETRHREKNGRKQPLLQLVRTPE